MTSPSPRVLTGLRDIADDFDVVLCDVWGVIHNGQGHHAAACEALQTVRRRGGAVVLITNAPRPHGPVLEQLHLLGVPRDTFDAVVTSGDVTLSYIAERGTAPLHHIGPPRDLAIFEALKATTGLAPPLVGLADADYVVCSGLFDDARETPDSYADTLAAMRARDLFMICANPDLVVHVGDTLLYCAGALAERYEAMGGRVLQAGKPHPPIYDRALELAAEARGGLVADARVLAIGDAMRTDIAGACRHGFAALFITGGIHRDELHRDEEPSALDREAYAQFLEGAPCQPLAAMPGLAW